MMEGADASKLYKISEKVDTKIYIPYGVYTAESK